MLEAVLTDLPDIKAPELSFETLKLVLKRLRPLQRYSFCVEACEEGDETKVWETWEMLNQISQNTILLDWSLRRTYVFLKAFALLTATAAFNSCNAELKQAGYRGFELPDKASEIAEWFKTLRNRLEEKHKDLNCKEGIMLVRFMDHNILAYLTETGNESTSEVGNEAVSEAGNDTTA
ncbi:uncharacterized protein LOC108052071 isoform X2 [Drosophila rhopaloa]|uniref:Uncharacterized protein LOC108052071 isoform X2 n=1 Tax=Drosophila rhopaloa TaxID=1041015 RepID=A0A6P4FKF9_DRORH|nr:uncharacterized protein LOC108052071 isoform X2 [Drosophila rhopaloa]